ncbi:MAG: PKD domain-containing protein [Actinobacteria bacterium]|nr:MAG: PKD domain-containing protein [Actinomycetota bacterium]
MVRMRGMVAGTAIRGMVAGAATLVLAGGVLVLGVRSGYPAERPQLRSGSAWLASAQVGQLTLLDGSSAEVAAQVPVATRGDRLDVVQQAATGYAVDRSTGTIRRVDGATFEVGTPASPLPGARDGLQAFAGTDAVYAMDSERGIITSADPKTLAARGTPVPLATQVSPQAAALDDAGRLWVLDPATGDLVWIDHGQPRSRRGVATPGAGLLVLADGDPVVVDTAARTATVLDPTDGSRRSRLGLDLRPGDRLQVSGSSHSPFIYLVADRGVLSICDLTATGCNSAVPLGSSAGQDLGSPVETGGRLFIPDYGTGTVWIVDLRQSRVIAQPTIVNPQTRFQLLTRDGVVFYNDPNSEHAGVIRLDGGVSAARKYDPKDPNKGVSGKSGPEGPPSQSPADPGSTPPGNPPAGPANPSGNRPGNPNDLAVQITMNRPSAHVGEDIGFKVAAVKGRQPISAQWSFGDGQTGPGLQPSHSWGSAQTYVVGVVATFADRRTATASAPVDITPKPIVAGPVNVTVAGKGTVTSAPAGIACPPSCSETFDVGSTVTLTAAAANGARFTGWSDGCAGTAPDCAVTVTATGVKATATFAALPVLTVKQPTSGSVTGSGISCPPTCSATYQDGQQVTLTAQPADQYYRFTGWTGACGGTGQCTVTMSGNQTVGAGFQDTAAPEDCIPYNPGNLTLVPFQSAWQMRDGNMWMELFDTQQDGNNGVSVARGFNEQCFVGRGTNNIMEYWQGGRNSPGPVSGEDCIGYNRSGLTIQQEPGDWLLTDGNSRMEIYTSQAAAVRGLRVAQAHRFQCFIGRNNQRPKRSDYIMEYYR